MYIFSASQLQQVPNTKKERQGRLKWSMPLPITNKTISLGYYQLDFLCWIRASATDGTSRTSSNHDNDISAENYGVLIFFLDSFFKHLINVLALMLDNLSLDVNNMHGGARCSIFNSICLKASFLHVLREPIFKVTLASPYRTLI